MGDLRGAVRLFSSTESPVASNDPHALEEMLAQNPGPHDQTDDFIPTLPLTKLLKLISCDEVQEPHKSFPEGTSVGPDGILSLPHLLDMLSVGGELRRILLVNLAKSCETLARGQVPDGACDIVFCSWLIASTKPTGDLRPIAIGNTLRRLTAKILLARVRGSAAAHLKPHHLSFATRRRSLSGVIESTGVWGE